MSEKLTPCPDCRAKVRPCNLARHRLSHMPTPETRWVADAGMVWDYIYYLPPKRPLMQYRTHDTRYDEIAPRGEGETQYRIYRLRGGELQLLAAAANPGSVGWTLLDLKKTGEFIPDDAVGVLDTSEDPGGWIVHPFALGRTREAA